GIAMNKVEDGVPAGIHSRDQVRPRYRALRGNRGGQTAERAAGFQSREVGHFAFLHELVEQARIHAVNAQYDEPLLAVPAVGGCPMEKGEPGADASQHDQRTQNPATCYQASDLSLTPIFDSPN